VGVHDLTLTITLKDFPGFEYFLKTVINFKLTITSACTSTVFGHISPLLKPYYLYNNFKGGVRGFDVDGLVVKVYDNKNWNVITLDPIMDSISTLAVNSYGRLPPPAKV
jgi:hypothetical protein